MSDARFKCPHCGQMFNGSRDNAGVETKCPSCGNVFTLVALDAASETKPNGFMCFLGIYRDYFGFKGRMRRREFWWTFFFWWVFYIASLVADVIVCKSSPDWISGLFTLGSLIPFAAAHVRRLHDTNKSGWWIPLVLLPPINIAYFVWLATDGDKGMNRFGMNPKER